MFRSVTLIYTQLKFSRNGRNTSTINRVRGGQLSDFKEPTSMEQKKGQLFPDDTDQSCLEVLLFKDANQRFVAIAAIAHDDGYTFSCFIHKNGLIDFFASHLGR